MGICHSGEETQQEQKSLKIDKELERDRGRREKEYKILLLGSGESGKSTILKQMKIINQNGYTSEELLLWRVIVYRNMIESIQTLIQAILSFNMTFDNEENHERACQVLNYQIPNDAKFDLEQDLIDAIQKIWQDPTTLKCIEEHGHRFYMMDSAPYFFDDISRIGRSDYKPTEQDVLHARLKTTGITEIKFQLGGLFIHMFDVGGQRSERKKWIHCFDSVASIIFCVALSEYDQVLLEESKQNRMMESLSLFESIINSRWFLHTSIMLFLNKVDIFKVKVLRCPMQNYFPDYGGGKDPNKAAKYILWRFLQTNRAKLNIYPHLTQATDTYNIRFVFAAVQETLLQNALRDSGMLF
ncbi:guanine nucleotide binding protein, alpha subunit [Halteromyces radiatus]|uniref:guanine nucleotide binding protein, alpha subunit n=1 Tax=Halteromyces radiatus TaxID=101107 RepID=UPI00222128FB|nr:guanine nucleotide binding protein, alpha subunit [Halteromyces radiatus]KAI8098900.1 guanine nucleotide binding protein, alpha subunit [Halteromyces radiatus]